MNKFIPREKLSKKAAEKLAKERRVQWAINPVSRKCKNAKLYDRKRSKRMPDDGGARGVCLSYLHLNTSFAPITFSVNA